jgi:hypothetical protein
MWICLVALRGRRRTCGRGGNSGGGRGTFIASSIRRVSGRWDALLGSGRDSSLCVWTDLSWFPPGLSLELRPTDGSTALPVLGGLVRRVPPAMLILVVAVTV